MSMDLMQTPHQLVEAVELDGKGRCCGRKPLVYKQPSLHFFCDRCDREFSANGKQQTNWAYEEYQGGMFLPRTVRGDSR